MVRIELTNSFVKQLRKTLSKQEAHKVLDLIETLKENPRKGKTLGNVGVVVIKELKYKKFRFYFLLDGWSLKCVDEKHLKDLLLRFVRMSDKKRQQQTFEEIKYILVNIGPEGFT